jgi:hypothetical protein
MLLASHDPSSPLRLALVIPGKTQTVVRVEEVRAWIESILRMDRRLFVTVAIEPVQSTSKPWRLVRFRLDARCQGTRMGMEIPFPMWSTKVVSGQQRQFHTFAVLIPEGAECLSLTLEEDGPRTLRLEDVRLPP